MANVSIIKKWFPASTIRPPRSIGGIYSLVNASNGKLYIGSATSFSKRWSEHRAAFNNGRHENIYLQRAFNKSQKHFEFAIVEEMALLQKEALLGKEQFWINFFKSYIPSNGYNISPTAGSCQGVKRSLEYRLKISQAQKGKKLSLETLRKRSATMKGRIPWQLRTPEAIEKMRQSKKGKKQSPEHIKRLTEARRVAKSKWLPVIQMDLSGKEIARFDSIVLAEQSLGRRSNISEVCKGKRNAAAGFKWRYVCNE